MKRRTPGLLVGTLALSVFLLAGAWASAQTPVPRCSRCERCLSSACQDPPAKTSLGPDLDLPLASGATLAVVPSGSGVLFAVPADPRLAALSAGFLRPMRS
jgi:hypothetical protein